MNQYSSVSYSMDYLTLLATITSFALIDSFDPCFYALFASIFISALMVNHRYAVKTGIVFIASVYTGYFIIALVAYSLLSVIKLPMQILGAILLIYGFLTLIMSILKNRIEHSDQFVCREDDIPCKIASKLDLQKYAIRSLFATLVIGLISSFTILTCSAQLLITYILLSRKLGLSLSVFIPLTLYYIAVFVSPIIVLFLGLAGLTKLKSIHLVLLRRERLVRIIGSLLMISIAIYILVHSETLYAV
jgi:cytochrome c biogenesis protein CcdA